MPQKYAMRTGRKFKNMDAIYQTGRKRNSHWSIAPEINFREMDFEEDDEKIKLDHNYKVFLEEDDLPVTADKKNDINKFDHQKVEMKVKDKVERRFSVSKPKILKKKPLKSLKSRSKAGGRSKKTKGRLAHEKKMAKSKQSSASKGGFIKAKQPSSANDEKIQGKVENSKRKATITKVPDFAVNSIHSQDASKGDSNKGSFLDSSDGQGNNPFSMADLKSQIQTKPEAQQLNILQRLRSNANDVTAETHDNEAIIAKRSVEVESGASKLEKRAVPVFNDAVKRARAALNLLQSKRQGMARPRADLMKVVSVTGTKPVHAEVMSANAHRQLQQKNLQESRNQALKLLTGTGLAHKAGENNGAIGDQNSIPVSNKIHNNVQNKAAANSGPNRPIDNHVKPPNVNPVAKLHPNQPTQGAVLSQRTNIETPQGNKAKDKMKIVPANVARAVAMAMEQLKRDRMWGKVFVHVLPSGKLKVMVQETKKMPDE